MGKIAIINCSHENKKQIDEVIDIFTHYFLLNHIETETIRISNLRIAACTECKVCMQLPGETPVKCFMHDNMDDIIDKMESANAFIFLSDTTSMFSANEVFQKFSKRLAAYYYWPFGTKSSTHRKKVHNKTSILVNYNTTMGFFKSSYLVALEQLKTNSIAVGAEPVAQITLKPSKNPHNFKSLYKKELEISAEKLLKSLTINS